MTDIINQLEAVLQNQLHIIELLNEHQTALTELQANGGYLISLVQELGYKVSTAPSSPAAPVPSSPAPTAPTADAEGKQWLYVTHYAWGKTSQGDTRIYLYGIPPNYRNIGKFRLPVSIYISKTQNADTKFYERVAHAQSLAEAGGIDQLKSIPECQQAPQLDDPDNPPPLIARFPYPVLVSYRTFPDKTDPAKTKSFFAGDIERARTDEQPATTTPPKGANARVSDDIPF